MIYRHDCEDECRLPDAIDERRSSGRCITWKKWWVGRQVLAQGVIETGNMTSEAAVTKLMWALGQYRTPEEVKSVMQQNLLGEMGNTMNWCE